MVALSKEAGRFYDTLMGIPFAVIGGRSSPSHEDRARAKLLFEAECLRMYAKPMARPVSYASEVPVPADWNGVDKDANDWGGWGKSCCNYDVCGYWGPALFKLGDSGGASEWKCATCRIEEEFQADLHNAGVDKDDLYGFTKLKLEEVTFSNISVWNMTKVTTLSHTFSDIIRKLLSDQQPEFVHTHGQPDGVGTVQNVDKIAKSIRKLKTDDAFKSWNNLKIPIDTERIRLLFSKISTEFGLRLSTSSPTTYKADTSTIHSLLMRLACPQLEKQLDHFLAWVSEVYGNTETIFGLYMTQIALRSASRSTALTEERSIYSGFFAVAQKSNEKLGDFLERFDQRLYELVLARHGREIEDEDLLKNMILDGMDSNCETKINETHKQTYKGQSMSMSTLRVVIDALSDYTPAKCTTKSIASHVRSEMQKSIASAKGVLGAQLAAAGIEGASSGGQGSQVRGGGAIPEPKFDCECCESTADKPLPEGSKHHYSDKCPFWALEIWVNDDDTVGYKCNAKDGTTGKPKFQILEEKTGAKPRWMRSKFKSSKHYKYLLRMRNKKDRESTNSVTSSGGGNSSASGKGGSKSKSAKRQKTDAAYKSSWEEVFGLNAHLCSTLELIPQPDYSGVHPIFSLNAADLMMSEARLVEGLGLFARAMADFQDDAPQFGVRRNDRGLLSCFLLASELDEGKLAGGDAARLCSYRPSKESIDEDCKREHHVYESQDGACQRSIELFVPLKMKAPKGNCVKWDQMLDLGAIGNFMSAAFAFKLVEHCSRGKDGDSVITDMGMYQEPQRINGADPTAPDGMHVIAFIKVRVNAKKEDGTVFTQEIKYDILNRTAIRDLRGAKQQSKDEGYPDIHDQISGANGRKEAYVIRMPTATSAGHVRLPIVRRINLMAPLMCPFLQSCSWDKIERNAIHMVQASMIEDADELHVGAVIQTEGNEEPTGVGALPIVMDHRFDHRDYYFQLKMQPVGRDATTREVLSKLDTSDPMGMDLATAKRDSLVNQTVVECTSAAPKVAPDEGGENNDMPGLEWIIRKGQLFTHPEFVGETLVVAEVDPTLMPILCAYQSDGKSIWVDSEACSFNNDENGMPHIDSIEKHTLPQTLNKHVRAGINSLVEQHLGVMRLRCESEQQKIDAAHEQIQQDADMAHVLGAVDSSMVNPDSRIAFDVDKRNPSHIRFRDSDDDLSGDEDGALDFDSGAAGNTSSVEARGRAPTHPAKSQKGDSVTPKAPHVQPPSQCIHTMSPTARAVFCSKVEGDASEMQESFEFLDLLKELQPLGDKVVSSGDNQYVIIGSEQVPVISEAELSIQDLAQMPILGEFSTEEILMSVSSGKANSDMKNDLPPTEPAKQSTYTEDLMVKCLAEAHKTKEFPVVIEIGSDFHVEFLYRHFTRLSPKHMVDAANKAAWKSVISKHLTVLSDTIGKMRCEPFKFQTIPGVKPIRQRMYPLSMVKKDALAKMLQVLLQNDVIEPCKQTDWLSPILLISKGSGRWRLVCDFRKLNMSIVNEPVAYPRPDDIFETVQEAFYMFLIDGRDFYFQRELHAECRPKTAFMTHLGAFQWKRCPQGLKPSSAAAINPITNLLIDVLFIWSLMHCDDLLGWAKTEQDSIARFDHVLTKFGEFGVTLGWFKVWILLEKAEYVSHVITQGKVYPSPDMVSAIDRMPTTLSNVKEVQSFVGMMQYFALYVPFMAHYRKRLTDLTRKDVKFEFKAEHKEAVAKLKDLLKKAMLYIVDWQSEFFLLTDASGFSLGGCLMQRDEKGNYRPVRFMSRGLDKYEQAQENREREMRAGWFSMLKCHSMLAHTVFTWFTDHANIRYAMQAKAEHERIARLALWLSTYYYNLQHLAGKHILLQIVDCISRLDIPDTQEDREIFSPFEAPEVQVILSSHITDDVVRCARQFEITTNTHAKLTRQGVDIVPNCISGAHLLNFNRSWCLRDKRISFNPVIEESNTIATCAIEESPLLFGIEMYGSFPTATTAMLRSDINVCASVEMNEKLLHTSSERPGESNESLHFDNAPALRAAVLQGSIELPHISLMHVTLGSHHSVQIRTSSRSEAYERADQALQLLSVLNSVQDREPMLLVTMVVPHNILESVEAAVRGRASKLKYSTSSMVSRASNHGDYTSKQIAFIVLRRQSMQHPVAMPVLDEHRKQHSELPLPSDVYDTMKQGAALSMSPFPSRECKYGGDRTGDARRKGHRTDKHRRLAVINAINVKCYSMHAPLPPIMTTLPSIVTNEDSDTSLWRARRVTHSEIGTAFNLTGYMQQEASSMPPAELVAMLSTTVPLATMTEYYASCVESIKVHLKRAPKVGGSAKAADVTNTRVFGLIDEISSESTCGGASDHVHEVELVIMDQKTSEFTFAEGCNSTFKINGELPKKGELYVAVVYVGYGSLIKPAQKILPGAKLVSFDIQPTKAHAPTIEGDYRQWDWRPFIEKHGSPAAIIFMPPCAPRSRQHKRGVHYDGNNLPTSADAVNADQCVDKAIFDIQVIQAHNPNLQWLIENPHYSKFTGLASVRPIIEAGDFTIIQYKDYDVTFTVKRTICLHNLRHWTPRPLSYRRNHKGLRWNSSAGWNQQRRWAWPDQLSIEVAIAIRAKLSEIASKSPMIGAFTKSMATKMRATIAKAASIAYRAASAAIDMASKAEKLNAGDSTVIEESDTGEYTPMSDQNESLENVLSTDNLKEMQANDANIQSWMEIARLKARIEEIQEKLSAGDESVTTKMVRDSQSSHHSALMSIRKDTRGFVDHMYINELGILVIANANREDPIPVISRSMGEIMIVRGHDQISTLHLGDKKLHSWLIERCWWYGIHADLQEHCRHCLMCQRMKFAASPGYGYQQLRWWNGPGKMVCIDLVVLTQSHTSSRGTRYIFTILDSFSHYPDAYTLKDAEAKDCANCLLLWVQSNGVPQEIRSDGGSNLNVSEIFKELYALLGIKSIVGNAYAPQANTVERFHRWLGAAMRILLFQFDLDVDESIPHVLWIWRSTVCRVTGFTPFMLHCGRAVRFPRDLFEGNVAEVSHTEYAEHLKALTRDLWRSATTAQRIAQHEAANYYNRRHGIKKDIGTGDVVLRKKIPRHPTDVPTHLLPRCTGPYRVLRISARGAKLEHATTGKIEHSSLRHLRRCLIRQGDDEYSEDGTLKLSSNDYVIVRMHPKKSSSDPKWQLAKLLHTNLDEDAWIVQWCNTRDTGPVARLDRKFLLSWRNEDGTGNEVFAMQAPPDHIPTTWVVTVGRFLTASFRLHRHGKILLPDSAKAIIRSKFESKFW